jgi:hypothetical protein
VISGLAFLASVEGKGTREKRIEGKERSLQWGIQERRERPE